MFELIRSNMRDLDIITFDELLEKIKSILSLFKNEESNMPNEKIKELEQMVKKSVKTNLNKYQNDE
jgi:hypothetical protein